MKSKKQLIVMAIALVVCLACLFGTTYAYFTDSESFKGNVVQVGTIDIELFESQYSREDVVTDTDLIATGAHYQEFLASAGKDVVPGLMVPKCPYLYNVGTNPAYVRFRIRVEEGIHPYLDFNWNSNLVGEGKEFLSPIETRYEEDGKMYIQYLILRSDPLPSKQISGNPLVSVGLKTSVTREDIAWLKSQGYLIDDDGDDSKFTITIGGDAIQTHSLENVVQAFEVFATVPDDARHD